MSVYLSPRQAGLKVAVSLALCAIQVAHHLTFNHNNGTDILFSNMHTLSFRVVVQQSDLSFGLLQGLILRPASPEKGILEDKWESGVAWILMCSIIPLPYILPPCASTHHMLQRVLDITSNGTSPSAATQDHPSPWHPRSVELMNL